LKADCRSQWSLMSSGTRMNIQMSLKPSTEVLNSQPKHISTEMAIKKAECRMRSRGCYGPGDE
jgi:hypothetical protein